MNSTITNVVNATDSFTEEPRNISGIVQMCFSIILFIVMFGVGCAGDFASLLLHFRHPAGICIGLLNQFIIMPLLALTFVYITNMPESEAMAVLIQGSSPGGMMSNIIAYWINGDVDLSISMTAVSTVIALGSMPLWLFIFTKILDVREDLQIPFSQLGIALAITVFPVIFGTILRRYKEDIAEKVTKILTIFGTIAIIVTLVVSGVVSGLSFHVSWKQCLVSFLTPAIGIILGYLVGLASFLKLDECRRRTVAIETGMQNCQISQSVLVISYASNIAIYEVIRLFPLINSGFQIMWGTLIVITERHCFNKNKHKATVGVPMSESKGSTGELDGAPEHDALFCNTTV